MPGMEIMVITRDAVTAALETLKAPGSAQSIVAAGLVSEIVIAGARVYFAITAPADRAAAFEPVRKAAEEAVMALEGVEVVRASLTAERAPGGPGSSDAPSRRPPPYRRPARRAAGPGGPGPAAAPPRHGASLANVSHIIAVASGKGGVGKSTTAVNLALALKADGLAVGILDADIYGPSMPRLLGIRGRPEPAGGRQIKPLEGHGVAVMSMGFLVDEDTPMIWRGPMVISAITQMLREVEWGRLDVMVVDMPPGTGDAQLTMAQQVPLAGAVIVSTPQDLALIDARKGLAMFAKVEVPVLGIVENMSTFICPHCGGQSDIFGHGGARAEAERLGVPFLGEIPLEMAIRTGSDEGRPVVAVDPQGLHAAAYGEIARKVRAALEGAPARAAPRIVVEE